MSTYIGANTGTEGSGVFGEGFVGVAYMTGAVGALVAPLLIGAVADSYVAAERILCVLHWVCAALLWHLATVESQWLFFWILVAHGVFFTPIISLTNAVASKFL